MNSVKSSPSIPVAWLKPLPEGYRIPAWRWLLLPATTLMLKRNRGVWINGTLSLRETDLHFAQAKAIKTKLTLLEEWTLPLEGTDLTVIPGFASETLVITRGNETYRLMAARSGEFVAELRRALAGQAPT